MNGQTKSFQQAAERLLDLMSSYMKGKVVFLGRVTPERFSVLKVKNHGTEVMIEEGASIPLTHSLCSLVFASRRTVVIPDTHAHEKASCIPVVEVANIGSYLGVPVFQKQGELFGTLCVADSTTSEFTEEDVKTFEGLAQFFSYVLELESLAKLDALTGLYNRRYLYSYFQKDGHMQQSGALFFLDLDGFKAVNDLLGHEMGDAVLQEVARRIHRVISDHDLGARLGGDEFVIDFSGIVDEGAVIQKAEELLTLLRNWDMFNSGLPLSVSIGIARYPEDGTEIGQLLKKADKAMYKAKQKGKNTYAFF